MEIEIYDKREESHYTLYVEEIADNQYRMSENDIFNCDLTLGTEFETRINVDGKHEVVRITKSSDFTTRRFLLSKGLKEVDFRMLGDELFKRGGYWQIDFGGIATVNIPKDFEFDIDQVMRELDIILTEIVDDDKSST